MADLLGTGWMSMQCKLLFFRNVLQVLQTEHTQLLLEVPPGLTAQQARIETKARARLRRRRRKECRDVTRKIQTLENRMQALTQRLVENMVDIFRDALHRMLLVVIARDPETRDTLHSAIHTAGQDTCRWPDPCPPPLLQTAMVNLQLDGDAQVRPVRADDDDSDTDVSWSDIFASWSDITAATT